MAAGVYAVEQDGVFAAQPSLGHLLGIGRHGASGIQPRRELLQSRPQPAIARAGAGSVKSADNRAAFHEQSSHGGAGHHRLMQMQDVKAFFSEHPDGAQLSGGFGGDGRDGAVGRSRQAVAQRRHPRVGRRAVARAQHAHFHIALAQSPGDAQNLALHPARHAQTIWTDHAHTHQTPAFFVDAFAANSFPANSLSRNSLSLGQLGDMRCHCSGA